MRNFAIDNEAEFDVKDFLLRLGRVFVFVPVIGGSLLCSAYDRL
jgi:hypothetical protein